MRKYTWCCSLQTSTSNPYSRGTSPQTVPSSSTKGTRPVCPNFPTNNRVHTPILDSRSQTNHTIITNQNTDTYMRTYTKVQNKSSLYKQGPHNSCHAQWSGPLGLFNHLPLKRDQGDWDWRSRLNDMPNSRGCLPNRSDIVRHLAVQSAHAQFANTSWMFCLGKAIVNMISHLQTEHPCKNRITGQPPWFSGS